MIEGGLAGTVNLNTRMPFDNDGFHIAFSAEANYGDFARGVDADRLRPDQQHLGYRLRPLRPAVSGAFSQIKSRADGLQIANYQTRDGVLVTAANTGGDAGLPQPAAIEHQHADPAAGRRACGNFGAAGADGFADYASYRVAPVGGQFRTQEFDRKRDGFAPRRSGKARRGRRS